MNYPTMEEVESADRRQLAVWYRFIPSPTSRSQYEILNRICDRFKEMGGMTPEISKSIGFKLVTKHRVYEQQSD